MEAKAFSASFFVPRSIVLEQCLDTPVALCGTLTSQDFLPCILKRFRNNGYPWKPGFGCHIS